MTKIDQLRKYIVKHRSITKMQAANAFCMYGLKEQLNRLKFANHEIVTMMIPRPNKQAYAKYTLKAK